MAGAAALLLLPKPLPPGDEEDDPFYQDPDVFEQAEALIDDVTDMSTYDPYADANLAAFRWMIRVSEGTDGINGYSTLVGGGLFDGFADHPRILVALPNLNIKSSAAGAYQILRRTWDEVKARLNLQDFSPVSQDLACNELIRRRGALDDVKAGRFAVAIDKCKKEWASLPGAGYGQHENTYARLLDAYTTAGGTVA